MAFGTTTKIINANRVTIKRVSVEVTLTSDVKVRRKRIADRTDTRAGGIDTYRWRIQEIEFTCALEKLIMAQLITDTTIDSRSKMTSVIWNINGLATSGSGDDLAQQAITAVMMDYEELAPSNGLANVRVLLREVPGAT